MHFSCLGLWIWKSTQAQNSFQVMCTRIVSRLRGRSLVGGLLLSKTCSWSSGLFGNIGIPCHFSFRRVDSSLLERTKKGLICERNFSLYALWLLIYNPTGRIKVVLDLTMWFAYGDPVDLLACQQLASLSISILLPPMFSSNCTLFLALVLWTGEWRSESFVAG
jgi:hypothetical protein